MLDYTLMVNTFRGLVGLVGAIGVVVGVINIDGTYDNQGMAGSPVGTVFFLAGWLLFALSVGLLSNDLSSFNLNLKALLGIVGSFLVAIAASLSQQVMYKKDMNLMMIFLVFFMVAWGILVYAISLPSGANDVNQFIRFILGAMGAIGVIAGMIFQMKNRKRGFDFVKTGKTSLANAYSPGLPFFTAGWLFLAFANAIL